MTVTITDNDAAVPTVSFAAIAGSVWETETHTLALTIDPPAADDITVALALDPSSTAAIDNEVLQPAELLIPAGTTSTVITIATQADADAIEELAIWNLALVSGTGAVGLDAYELRIVDKDAGSTPVIGTPVFTYSSGTYIGPITVLADSDPGYATIHYMITEAPLGTDPAQPESPIANGVLRPGVQTWSTLGLTCNVGMEYHISAVAKMPGEDRFGPLAELKLRITDASAFIFAGGGVDAIPSRVSPACIEGSTQADGFDIAQLSFVALDRLTDQAIASSAPTALGLKTYYTDLKLFNEVDGNNQRLTKVEQRYRDGTGLHVLATQTYEWIVSDLAELDVLTIRRGDTLLVTCSAGSSRLSLENNVVGNLSIDPSQVVPLTFPDAGYFSLVATENGQQRAQMQVAVLGYQPTNEIVAAEIGFAREHGVAVEGADVIPGLSVVTQGAAAQPALGITAGQDDELEVAVTQLGYEHVALTVKPLPLSKPEDLYRREPKMVLRAGGADGDVIAAVEITDFEMALDVTVVPADDESFTIPVLVTDYCVIRPAVPASVLVNSDLTWQVTELAVFADIGTAEYLPGARSLARPEMSQSDVGLGVNVPICSAEVLTGTVYHYWCEVTTNASDWEYLRFSEAKDALGIRLYEPLEVSLDLSFQPAPSDECSESVHMSLAGVVDYWRWAYPDSSRHDPDGNGWSLDDVLTGGIIESLTLPWFDGGEEFTVWNPIVARLDFVSAVSGRQAPKLSESETYVNLEPFDIYVAWSELVGYTDEDGLPVEAWPGDNISLDEPTPSDPVTVSLYSIPAFDEYGDPLPPPSSSLLNIEPDSKLTEADVFRCGYLANRGVAYALPGALLSMRSGFNSAYFEGRTQSFRMGSNVLEVYLQEYYSHGPYSAFEFWDTVGPSARARPSEFNDYVSLSSYGDTSTAKVKVTRSNLSTQLVGDGGVDLFAVGALEATVPFADAYRLRPRWQIDGETHFLLEFVDITGDPLEFSFHSVKDFSQGEDGLSPGVAIYPAGVSAKLATGNVLFARPLKYFAGNLPGPDLAISYNSLDGFDVGWGPGWRTNYDLRVLPEKFDETSWWLIDEVGTRERTTGGDYSPDYLHEQNKKQDENGNYLASGPYRSGERHRIARRDGWTLYFDDDGFLARKVSLDGHEITIVRHPDDPATLVNESRVISRVHSSDGREVVLAELLSSLNGQESKALNAGASGSWSFTYHGATKHGVIDTITLTGTDDTGHFAFTSGGDSQTLDFEFSDPEALPLGKWVQPVLQSVKLDDTYTLSCDYTWDETRDASSNLTAKGVSAVTVTNYDGTKLSFDAFDDFHWTEGTGIDGVKTKRSFGANSIETTQIESGETAETGSYARSKTTFGFMGFPNETEFDFDGATHVTKYKWSDLTELNPDLFGAAVLLTQTELGVLGVGGANFRQDLASTYRYHASGNTAGKLRLAIDPCGNGVTYTYDAKGFLGETNDQRGKDWDVQTDALGQATGSKSPAGRTTAITSRTAAGSPKISESALGYGINAQYDALERPVSVTRSGFSTAATTAYDPLGRVTGMTDERDRSVSMTYDRLGRLRTRTTTAGTSHGTTDPTIALDGESWVWTKQTPTGAWQVEYKLGDRLVSRERYNEKGQLIASTVLHSLVDGVASPTECTTDSNHYNARGQLTAVYDPEDGKTDFEYDELGRTNLVRVQTGGAEAGGYHETTAVYNTLGWLLAEERMGLTTRYVYDACGRVIRVINPGLGVQAIYYDEGGEVVAGHKTTGRPQRIKRDDDGVPEGSIDQRELERQQKAIKTANGAQIISSTADIDATVMQYLDDMAMPSETKVQGGGGQTQKVTRTFESDGALTAIQIDDQPRRTFVVDGYDRRLAVTTKVRLNDTLQPVTVTQTPQVGTGIMVASGNDLTGYQRSLVVNAVTGEPELVFDNRTDAQLYAVEKTLERNKRGQVTRHGYFTSAGDGSATPEIVITRTYYADGLLETESRTGQPTMSYEYDDQRRLWKATRGTAKPTIYQYDVLGNLVKVTTPDGETTEREYDVDSKLLSATEAGETIIYSYDPDTLDVEAVQKGSEPATTYERNKHGQMKQLVRPNGTIIDYLYDQLGRLFKIISTPPGGGDPEVIQEIAYTPGKIDEVHSVTDGAGRTTTFSYDSELGVQIGRNLDDGTVITQATREPTPDELLEMPDAVLVSVRTLKPPVGANQIITRYTDRQGRQVGLRVLDQDLIRFAYDHAGRQVERDRFRMGYTNGQLTSVDLVDVNGDPITALHTEFSYEDGRLDTVLLPNGLERNIAARDESGRVTTMTQRITAPGTASAWSNETYTVQRDGLGRISQTTGPDGVTDYTYIANRLAVEERSGTVPLYRLYGYDDNGNRTAVIDYLDPVTATLTLGDGPTDSIISLEPGNQIGNSITSGSPVALVHPDLIGNRIGLTVTPAAPLAGGTSAAGCEFGFAGGPVAVLWEVRDAAVSPSNPLGDGHDGRLVLVELDAAGHIAAELDASLWVHDASILSNSFTVTLLPDASNEARLEVTSPNGYLSYARSDLKPGLLATKPTPTQVPIALVAAYSGTETAASATVSEISWMQASARLERYTGYDSRDRLDEAIERRLAVIDDGQGGTTFELQVDQTIRYGFDEVVDTNLTTVTHIDHLNGDAETEVASYDYDILNRMVSSTAGGVNASYRYAADSIMRVGVDGPGGNREFRWDGSDIIAERAASGGAWTWYAQGGGGPLWQAHDIDGSLTTASFGRDLRGNVTGLVGQVNTVAGGHGLGYQVKRSYDAWGGAQSLVAQAMGQTVEEGLTYVPTTTRGFGYRGQWHDDATEMVYLRNRYYQPGLGSFVTEDPARAGGNWYAYAGGDPVNRWDPSGLDFEWVDGRWSRIEGTPQLAMPPLWLTPDILGSERYSATDEYIVGQAVQRWSGEDSPQVTAEDMRGEIASWREHFAAFEPRAQDMWIRRVYSQYNPTMARQYVEGMTAEDAVARGRLMSRGAMRIEILTGTAMGAASAAQAFVGSMYDIGQGAGLYYSRSLVEGGADGYREGAVRAANMIEGAGRLLDDPVGVVRAGLNGVGRDIQFAAVGGDGSAMGESIGGMAFNAVLVGDALPGLARLGVGFGRLGRAYGTTLTRISQLSESLAASLRARSIAHLAANLRNQGLLKVVEGLPDLGATLGNGAIELQAGLPRAVFAETLRHEAFHSIFLRNLSAPFRDLTGEWYSAGRATGTGRHAAWVYMEEALADYVGTGNIFRGLEWPFSGGYIQRPGWWPRIRVE
ncbi:MAG: hypothetical protein PF961_17605 [Planctomycetota bacterium]|nr:hypothetical protein [Planctomycetota bacterium]